MENLENNPERINLRKIENLLGILKDEILDGFTKPVAEVLYQLQPHICPDNGREISPKLLEYKKDFFEKNEIYLSGWDKSYFYVGGKGNTLLYYQKVEVKRDLFLFLVKYAIENSKSEIIFSYNKCLACRGPPAYTNGYETSNEYVDTYYRGMVKLDLEITDKIPKLEMVLLGKVEDVLKTY